MHEAHLFVEMDRRFAFGAREQVQLLHPHFARACEECDEQEFAGLLPAFAWRDGHFGEFEIAILADGLQCACADDFAFRVADEKDGAALVDDMFARIGENLFKCAAMFDATWASLVVELNGSKHQFHRPLRARVCRATEDPSRPRWRIGWRA